MRDLAHQLRDYANCYTTMKHHDELITGAAAEIERLRKIEASAVEVVNAPEWQGDEFCELLGKLSDVLRGE